MFIIFFKCFFSFQANIDNLEKKVDELCKKYQDARTKAKGNSGNNTPNNGSSPNQQKTAGAHNAWGGFIRYTKFLNIP